MLLLVAIGSAIQNAQKRAEIAGRLPTGLGQRVKPPAGAIGGLLAVWLLALVLLIGAVVVAVRCNPQNPFLFGALAFFFPEIYLIQYAIRKFAIREPGYCLGMGGFGGATAGATELYW